MKKRLWIVSVVVIVAMVSFGLLTYFNSLLSTQKMENQNPSVTNAFDVQKSGVNSKKLVYIVSDLRIPFWSIMARGIETKAKSLGYTIEVYSADNDPKLELEYVAKALKERVGGIILSPTTSSACATILKLAKASEVPVVISDIGTDGGEYVSYISSNNYQGAYEIGKVLSNVMKQRHITDGKVGIIAIPQKRLNGQRRTAGFMKAMDEAGIKSADLKQQATFSYEETFEYTNELIEKYPDLKAIWLQGSDRYKGALDAIAQQGKKDRIVLLTFDAEPEFLDLIPKGILVGSAMQQPYLMGQEAVSAMDLHLKNQDVKKDIQLPVLAISAENIGEKKKIILLNVLGKENNNQ